MAAFRNGSNTRNVCHRLELPTPRRRSRRADDGRGLFPGTAQPRPTGAALRRPESAQRDLRRAYQELESVNRHLSRSLKSRERAHLDAERELSSRREEEERRQAEWRREIEVLERRIAKLTAQVENQGAQLQLAGAGWSPDEGIPSIYGEVQGLADDASQAELKRVLMSRIFEANVELLERIASLPSAAE